MKRKLALLMAAAMTVACVPATSFAASTNRINKVVTGQVDAPVDDVKLSLEDKGDFTIGQDEKFILKLTGAEFDYTKLKSNSVYTVDDVTAKEAVITYTVQDDDSNREADDIKVGIHSILKDEGDATVTVDPLSSNVSAGTYTFATVSGGDTKTTIEKSTDVSQKSTQIKPIVITEVVAGTIKPGERIKLKLGGNFTFAYKDAQQNSVTPSIKVVTGNHITTGDFTLVNNDEDTIEFEVNKNTASPSTSAVKIVIDNLYVEEDDAEAGDIAEITVSGAGVTKETLEVAKYVDYGYTWEAEDEEVPVVYSGRTNGDTDLLKVTFKETAEDSFFTKRDATITLPEGVKFKEDPTVKNPKNCSGVKATINEKDRSVVDVTIPTIQLGKKAEVEFEFEVEVAPDFTGDIVATFGGPAVTEELEAVVATAVAPVTVKAEKTDVSIDYRNVEVANITITEAYPGALEKDTTLSIQAEKMEFESGMEWEVTEGDIKIDKVEKKTNDGTSQIDIKVKSESSKTASTIEISNLKVYLDRTLPVGDYALKLVANTKGMTFKDGSTEKVVNEYADTDSFFQTYNDDATDKQAGFDVDSVKVVEDYIRVVTAGRDQGDSTFTTKITVKVGESTLTAGDKVVNLDAPAFINADSRVMLPVRAVVEALSGTVAIKWDDATKTAFFSMGSRVFSMTVGSNTMSINGTNVAMTTAPVIVNERIFIPLRDLGIALGLNDDKIVWDDATKTATLN